MYKRQRLVTPFADQVAVAIENARLYERIERSLEQLTTLRQTSLDITARLDTTTLLEAIVRRATELLQAKGGGVYLYDPIRQELTVAVDYGLERSTVGTTLKLGEGMAGRVAQTGEPLIVDDYQAWPGRSDKFAGDLFTAVVEVPLKWQDRVIGVLAIVDDKEKRVFTDADVQLLSLFADQAAIAIENARLYEETRRRSERLSVVNRIARAASATLRLDELVETVYEEISRVFLTDAFYLALYDEETNMLDFRLRVDKGIREPPRREPMREGLTAAVVTRKEPLLIQDFEREKENLPPARLWGTMKAPSSWLGVPMLIGDRVVGVISVQAYRPQAYGEEEQSLLSTIADQVAVAIENARLYEETRRRLVREERLNQLAHALGGEMELATLLPRLLPTVVELTGADAGTVAILDPERQVVAYPYHYNLPPSLTDAEVPANTGLVGYTMQERRTVHVDDYREHPKALQPWAEAGVRSVLSVPLLVGEEVVGALGLFNLGEVRPFGPEAIATAEAAGQLAAVAIQRARLYEEIRQRAAELSILYEVAIAAMTSVRLDEVLDRTIAALQEKLPADCIAILLVEPDTDELITRSSIGFPGGPKLVRRPIGVGIPGWVVQTGQPALVADVREDERYQMCDPDTRSELCVPLQIGERIIGALNLESHRIGAFDEEDLRLLSILAGHLAAVIENARLVEGLEAEVAARTAEIRAEQEKSETILRSVGDAIAMTDLEWHIRYINDAFASLTGYQAEELMGRCALSLFTEKELPSSRRQAIQETLSQGRVWQGEVSMRRKDGRIYDASLTIAPMCDAEGKLIGYVSSHRDISQVKELERARSRFMTNVSHELRTPVANVKLYTQLLRKAQRLEKVERYLEVLEQQVDRLAHLIEDILEMTNLDSGQAVSTWAPVQLVSVIGDVVTRYQRQAEAAGVTLMAKPLPPDLPQVQGDRARLTQALGELVENAIIFTPAGGRVTIETKSVEEGEQRWVTIAVRDTGPGISPEEQERIFERFYRGKLAETGHIPGTGLGLSIVREIMRAHGGRVTVESEVGKGSTFTLWLRVTGATDG